MYLLTYSSLICFNSSTVLSANRSIILKVANKGYKQKAFIKVNISIYHLWCRLSVHSLDRYAQLEVVIFMIITYQKRKVTLTQFLVFVLEKELLSESRNWYNQDEAQDTHTY